MRQNLISEDKARLSSLDLLKGICICMVIFTHMNWSSEDRANMLFPWWIDMAVPVFIIISGITFTISFERQGLQKLEDAYCAKSLLKKVSRFTIPFLIAYAIEIMWDHISPNDVIEYDIIPTLVRGGLGPGSYYYPIMMQFILLAPVVYFIVKRKRAKGVFLCLIINLIYEFLHVMYGMPTECYRLIVVRYTFLIAVGCYLSLNLSLHKGAMLAMFGVGALFLCMTCYWGYKPKILIDWTRTCFLSSMYIVPVVAIAIRKCEFRCRPLELLGKASYNIFLTQMVYFYAMSKFVYRLVENKWLQLAISMIVCITGGILFYYVETPITKWINNRIDAKAPPKVPK